MADNEKLDNQRLKNFKNKGRDLEVKVEQIGVEDRRSVRGQLRLLASLWRRLLISTIGNFTATAAADVFTGHQF